MSIQRYDCTNGGAQFCQGCYTMTPDSDGVYVTYADHLVIVDALSISRLAGDAQRVRAEKVETERDALRDRAARLVGAIEAAPHDMDCESVRIKDDGYGPVMVDAYPPKPCNCWKRTALEGK